MVTISPLKKSEPAVRGGNGHHFWAVDWNPVVCKTKQETK